MSDKVKAREVTFTEDQLNSVAPFLKPLHVKLLSMSLKSKHVASYENMSDATGLKLGTVKSNMHRARLFLARELAKLNNGMETQGSS